MSAQLYAQAAPANPQVDAPTAVATPNPRARNGLAAMPQSALDETIRAVVVAGAKPSHQIPKSAGSSQDTAEAAATGVSDELVTACLGSLGGMAVDIMAPHAVRTLAVIGTGPAAEAQIEATLSARTFTQIRLYGRQPVAAAALVQKFRNNTTATITVSASPEEAVHNADVIILASDHAETVIDADWVSPGAHISAVARTNEAHHLFPKELAYRARTIASDSPDTLGVNAGAHHADFKQGRVAHLGALVDRFNPDINRAMTLFISARPVLLAKAALGVASSFVAET